MANATKQKGREHSVEYYLSLNLKTIVEFDEESNIYIARVKGWKGCSAHGKTILEAVNVLEDVKKMWVEDAIDSEYPIPIPKQDEDYSGKFLVRVPKSIHREVADRAEEEGVSLNQWVLSILAKNI